MTNPLYFIETTSPRIRGPWFLELDRDSNSRASVIELIRSGEVNAFKVLEVNESEGTCRDVTADILEEVEAMAANDDLPEDEPREWDRLAFKHDHDRAERGAV